MKKLLAITLILVYGLSSMGTTVHFQYCCGKLEKIDFVPPVTKHCAGDKGSKIENKKCCDDKEVSLKISSEQSAAQILYPASFPIAIKPVQPGFSFQVQLKLKIFCLKSLLHLP